MDIFLRDQRSQCLWDFRVVNGLKVSVSFFEKPKKWRSVFSAVHHGFFVGSSLVFDFLNILICDTVDGGR
jgi:hypothetical protein